MILISVTIDAWIEQSLLFHTDIDECANDILNNCHEDARCTNTEGGFNCSCNDGYSGNGTECTGKLVACSLYVYIPVKNSSSLLLKHSSLIAIFRGELSQDASRILQFLNFLLFPNFCH